MRLHVEDRVAHAYRNLQYEDARRVARILDILGESCFEDIKKQFQIHKLMAPGEHVFVLKVSSQLRILFKYGDDNSLIIEDIVSQAVLGRFFGGGKG